MLAQRALRRLSLDKRRRVRITTISTVSSRGCAAMLPEIFRAMNAPAVARLMPVVAQGMSLRNSDRSLASALVVFCTTLKPEVISGAVREMAACARVSAGPTSDVICSMVDPTARWRGWRHL